MIRRYIALIVVAILIGLSSPALAGDLVSPKLLALPSIKGAPGSIAAFSLQTPGQPQNQSQPQSQAAPTQKHWSHGGKILTIVGLAFVGAGAVMMTRSNQTIYSTSTQDVQINWRATGAGTAATGAVLAIIGLTRKD